MVMMYYDPDYKITRDPAVVKFKDEYFLYYTTLKDKIYIIGIAKSRDLFHWVKVGELIPTEDYEGKGICAPFAGIDRNGNIFLLYQTNYFSLEESIAYSFSKDGVNFTKPKDINPILKIQNNWSLPRAIDADLLETGDRRFLYFATRLRDNTNEQVIGVAIAETKDPFNFISVDKPILKGEYKWEKSFVEAPSTCYKNGKFFMFYGGGTNPQYVGVAISDDGLNWKKLYAEPFIAPDRVLDINGLKWEQKDATHPFFFSDGEKDYIFFHSDYKHSENWPRASAITWVEIEWCDLAPKVLFDEIRM
jgi:predicted GH43/DUF377 family glycosyl hydrolase